jgi:putative transposase
VSIRYTELLAKAGIEPSVGSVGDAYEKALAETINGLYKTEVIRRCGLWKTMEEVELETLKWPCGDASIAYRPTDRLVQQQAPA